MLRPETIRDFFSGEKRVSAAKLNAMAAAIRELARRTEGLQTNRDLMMMTAGGAKPEIMAFCRITSVNLPGSPHPDSAPGQPAYVPSDVTYNVVGIDDPGIDLTNQTPYYGRPDRYDVALIHPASVDDLCWVEWLLDPVEGEETIYRLGLMPGREVVARRTCGGG